MRPTWALYAAPTLFTTGSSTARYSCAAAARPGAAKRGAGASNAVANEPRGGTFSRSPWPKPMVSAMAMRLVVALSMYLKLAGCVLKE